MVVDALNVQVVPLDEVLLQSVVHGAQLRDVRVTRDGECAIFAAIDAERRAQHPAQKRHGRLLGDVGLERLQVETGQLGVGRHHTGFGRHLRFSLDLAGPVDSGVSFDLQVRSRRRAEAGDVDAERIEAHGEGGQRLAILARHLEPIDCDVSRGDCPAGRAGRAGRGRRIRRHGGRRR